MWVFEPVIRLLKPAEQIAKKKRQDRKKEKKNIHRIHESDTCGLLTCSSESTPRFPDVGTVAHGSAMLALSAPLFFILLFSLAGVGPCANRKGKSHLPKRQNIRRGTDWTAGAIEDEHFLYPDLRCRGTTNFLGNYPWCFGALSFIWRWQSFVLFSAPLLTTYLMDGNATPSTASGRIAMDEHFGHGSNH